MMMMTENKKLMSGLRKEVRCWQWSDPNQDVCSIETIKVAYFTTQFIHDLCVETIEIELE